MPKRKTKHESEAGTERIQTYVEVFKLFACTRGHVTINLKSGNEISVHSLVYLTFGHSNSKRLQTSIAGAIALPPSLPLSCVHTTLPLSLSLSLFVSVPPSLGYLLVCPHGELEGLAASTYRI